MSTTTKIAALAAAGFVAATMAACDPSIEAASPSTSSATIEPAAEQSPAEGSAATWTAEPDDTVAEASTTIEDIYIAVLDEQGAFYATEAQAIDAAKLLCLRMDTGENLSAIMWEYTLTDRPINSGVSTDSTGTIAGAGIPAFCPQHRDQLDSFVGTWAE